MSGLGGEHRVRARRAPLGVARRRGTVMLLFAMIVVALLGTIAVVIELGLARANQRRMQSAADMTAREVLRERDFATTAAEVVDAAARDFGRRDRNRRFASWTFAATQEASYVASEEGAGSHIEVQQGAGELNLGQRLVGTRHGVPVLETNYSGGGNPAPINAPHGDIVSGRFTGHTRLGAGQEYDPAHYLNSDGNPMYLEGSDFSRVDFEPAAPGQAPDDSSVVVRLRRTVAQGLGPLNALDQVAGVSSSGWTLPLTFGAGAPFQGANPGGEYSIRHHGLPLRATAIASARPALRVGLPHPELGEEWALGIGPLTFRDSTWRIPSSQYWQVDTDGSEYIILNIDINGALRATGVDSTRVGMILIPQDRRVGDELVPLPAGSVDADSEFASPTYWSSDRMIIPSFLERNIIDQGNRFWVAGFFLVKAELYVDENGDPIPVGGNGEVQDQIKLTRLGTSPDIPENYVMPRNASATLDGLHDTQLPEGVWPLILSSLETTRELVQAPVLVR